MQYESAWENVLKTALLGTERQPLSMAGGVQGNGNQSDDLGVLLSQLNGADSEAALLSAASALTLYQRAGHLPAMGKSAVPEPCPPDTLPRCSAQAGTRLAMILQGHHRQVLPEWLAAAQTVGLRAPEEVLPELLDAGRSQSELRAAIRPMLGRRGLWLAEQNRAWKYVAGDVEEGDETVWETGNRGARLLGLQHWRGIDPARAREMLLPTWEKEPAKERTDFLQTFKVGLSMADEPFLETVLDDKRKETRTVAADLLARLPESRLVQRMIERVRPHIKLVSERSLKKLLKETHRLEVTLPEAFDKAMERDGIAEKPIFGAQRSMGEKAWWLHQMVALIPPDFWCQEWGKTPAEIIEAANSSEWKEALVDGLRQAAQRHQSVPWLEAFLADALERKQFSGQEIVQGLPPQRIEEFVLAALASVEGKIDNVQSLLAVCTHPWSEPFARAVLQAAQAKIADAQTARYHWLHYALKGYAHYLPPTMVQEAGSNWPTDSPNWDYWRPAVDEMLGLLQFRYEMLQELKAPVASGVTA
ncbi:MAG: hypothetical protein JO316_24740 [Abitibacteriaceae bacterium]|nr:hypothetical protein [Abditibacteriaceae bacterium]MBV9868575.1 hypothetical protein [Abditibacteriaceae bacterium]